jgi:hypothetical protein
LVPEEILVVADNSGLFKSKKISRKNVLNFKTLCNLVDTENIFSFFVVHLRKPSAP